MVAVGGPCKANEVAAGRPTAAVFAGEDRAVVERCAGALATPAYRVERSRDLAGVEAAAATKNVYAIAIGICHGLTEAGGEPWHDLAAATFTQAVAEMRRLAAALGGREETVLGLAGLGDLEVTSLSGRNRELGARVGRGEPPGQALAAMAAAGQTVEGVPAARLARDLATQAGPELGPLPLLEAVNRVLDGTPTPPPSWPRPPSPGNPVAPGVTPDSPPGVTTRDPRFLHLGCWNSPPQEPGHARHHGPQPGRRPAPDPPAGARPLRRGRRLARLRPGPPGRPGRHRLGLVGRGLVPQAADLLGVDRPAAGHRRLGA